MTGPLNGIRIIEFASVGPGPFCGMMLGDHGAEVIRIERPGDELDPRDALCRNRQSIVLNTKTPEGLKIARDLCRTADGLIEGYRPGVMERLGLGPAVLLDDNPRLVYGRMTGWGQSGPLAAAAGHDINYIALSGALHTIGRKGEGPTPPVNYVGDFGGGAMMLAFGMVSALLSVRSDGVGQVVDCAMTEGSALLTSMSRAFLADGSMSENRGENLIDGGAHFYDCYECADGKHIAIGSIEPQFYALLRKHLDLAHDQEFDAQFDRTTWRRLKVRLAAIFRTKSRQAWCSQLEGTDICFAPVLSMSEAPLHPHNVARHSFIEVGGVLQAAPAPRYSVTTTDIPKAAPAVDKDRAKLVNGLRARL